MSQTSLVTSSSSSSSRQDLRLRLTAAEPTPAPAPAAEASTFARTERYIYKGATAAYHVSTRNTQSGKPWQLALSRVLPSQAKRVAEEGPDTYIRYDDDLTLYSGEKMHIPISLGSKPLLAIRGHKKGTPRGTIVLEKGARCYNFWLMVPLRRPLNKAEEDRMQALMHKRGYRDSDDWRRELVVSVAGGEWRDEKSVLAREKDGKLDVVDVDGDEDLLVACWACMNFVLTQ